MKLKELKLLTMNLQTFNDGDSDAENNADANDSNANGGTGEDSSADGGEGEKPADAKKYDDAEVDAIIARKKAQWEKDHKVDLEKAREEARKYERMSKEQREEADRKKAEEEAAKKDARIAELEAQIARDEMRKTVAKDVEALPEGFVASQDFLDLTVVGDAEQIRANVEKYKRCILADRKAQELKRARGNTPRSYGSNNGGSVTAMDAIIKKYQ